ncbi:hypothetical protein [Sphingomonas sp.]|uniref:hypothetical protein n=1 Tax=Sphingomonas sp. TaxID=28214 RepID=UPI001EC5C1EE|nr:hypothetical protein [Sphingomonas sp.]MBX3593062.1 hypothetical protein [Sphingomonas sp.]
MRGVASIEHVARAGHLARSVVYGLAGYMTLHTRHSEGTSSVFDDIAVPRFPQASRR